MTLTNHASVTVRPIPGIPFDFCAPLGPPRWFYVYWIPLMVFETILFTLALVKGYTSVRFHFETGSASGKSLLECLIRDSIFYFAV